MSNESVLSAFMARMADFASTLSPELPVAWPNVHFTPPDAGMWLEVRWFPNETFNYGIGNDGPSQLRGFFQVTCCDRAGGGAFAVTALSDEVIAGFAKGTVLGPVRVERQPWASSALDADDRTVVPVTIRYQGLVTT